MQAQRNPTRADVVRLTAILDESMRKRGIMPIAAIDEEMEAATSPRVRKVNPIGTVEAHNED